MGASDRPAPALPIRPPGGVPQLPEVERLEELAAGATPSLTGAWWIGLQVCEHLLGSAAELDPRTGELQPTTLGEALQRMVHAGAEGLRPLPQDALYRAALLSLTPLEQALGSPRSHLHREHEVQPLHHLRELDNRCMAWLARRPGINFREKLGSSGRALGVKRGQSVDLPENRFLRFWLKELQERGAARLGQPEAYDPPAASSSGAPGPAEVLSRIEELATERLRTSLLATVDPRPPLSSSNVLLSDPLYSIAWRGWVGLQLADEGLPAAWAGLEVRLRHLLFCLLVGTLAQDARTILVDGVARVREGGLWVVPEAGDGWKPLARVTLLIDQYEMAEGELTGSIRRMVDDGSRPYGFIHAQGMDYYFDDRRLSPGCTFRALEPEQAVCFVPGQPVGRDKAPPAGEVRPRDRALLLELTQVDQEILLRQAVLVGTGFHAPRLSAACRWSVGLQPEAELAGRRGVPLRVQLCETDTSELAAARQAPADLVGFRLLVDWLVRDVWRSAGLAPAGPIRQTASAQSVNVAGGEPDASGARVSSESLAACTVSQAIAGQRALGLDLSVVRWHVTEAGATRALQTPHHAWRLTLPDDHPGATERIELRIQGQPRRRIERSPDGSGIFGLIGSLQREQCDGDPLPDLLAVLLPELHRELDPGPAARLAYTVPDILDELAQLPLRAALRTEFPGALPIWRSVAAALGWQGHWLGGTVARPASRPMERDLLLVLDGEAPTFTITLLVARHDQKLEQQQPATGGIVWERRATLIPGASEEDAGWPALLRSFGQRLLARAAARSGRNLSIPWLVPEQELLLDGLLESDLLAGSLEQQRCVWLPWHDRWLGLAPDPEGWQSVLKSGLTRMQKLLQGWASRGPLDDLLRELRSAPGSAGRVHLLLVGQPFEGSARLAQEVRDRWWEFLRDREQELVSWERLPSRQLAAGGCHFLSRLRAGLPTWTDWLPRLALEVLQDGCHGELSLLEPRSIEPAIGRAVSFEVPTPLVLDGGELAFRFPLIIGQDDRTSSHFEAEFTSPLFPLAQPRQVRLTVRYSYGLEQSYELDVQAVDQTLGRLGRIKAGWRRGMAQGESSAAFGIPPAPVGLPRASPEDLQRERENLPGFVARIVDQIEQIRCFGAAQLLEWLRRQLKALRICVGILSRSPDELLLGELSRFWQADGARPLWEFALDPAAVSSSDEGTRVLRQLIWVLSGLGLYSPDWFVDEVRIRLRSGRLNSTIAAAWVGAWVRLAEARPDDRMADLGQLLHRLAQGEWSGTWRVRVFNSLVTALAERAWRNDGYLAVLAARVNDAPTCLVQLLSNEVKQMGHPIPEGRTDLKGISVVFATCCELLLALLRLQETRPAAALNLSPVDAQHLARKVRLLDGALVRAGFPVRPRHLHLDVPGKPVARHRVSDLAFLLDRCLCGDVSSASHVRIASAQDDADEA